MLMMNVSDSAFKLTDQQLADARCELVALEQSLELLPQILEDKYRHHLASVVQTNRQLFDQQLYLRQCLVAAASSSRLLPPSRRMRPILIVMGCVGVLALVCTSALLRKQLTRQALMRPSAVNLDRPASVVSDSMMQLSAKGESWVEVQDLVTQETLFVGVLNAGDFRKIRLRRGLRIRSGRPDLLSLQIDTAPPIPFGEAPGEVWRTVLPPELKKARA
jgi:hypothetical protein